MKYHPDIELLLKYANGQLPASISVAIGIHQHECQLCQERVADIEAIGGDAIELSQSSGNECFTPMEPNQSFEKLMGDIGSLSQFEEESEYAECAVADVDRPILAQLGNRDFSKLVWKRVTPWIKKAEVPLGQDGNQIEVLKFAPNAKIPQHTHKGEEITVVLEGDFSDAEGTYHEGEFIIQDQSNEHQPVAGKDGCICLAVTTAPLNFTGTFGPVLNWFNR